MTSNDNGGVFQRNQGGGEGEIRAGNRHKGLPKNALALSGLPAKEGGAQGGNRSGRRKK